MKQAYAVRRLFFGLCSGLLWAGCATTQPAISDIRHDVVKVQAEPLLTNPFGLQHVEATNTQRKAQAKAEAERGCQLYERGVSNLLSARCVQFAPSFFGPGPCIRSEYLFACTRN